MQHYGDITVKFTAANGRTIYGQVEVVTSTEWGIRWDGGCFTYEPKGSVEVVA